jgi:hypothetical protein
MSPKPRAEILDVEPNEPIREGAEYTVIGEGYPPNAVIHIASATPGCCAGNLTVSDSDGKFRFSSIARLPDTTEMAIFSYKTLAREEKGKSGKFRLVVTAELYFEVKR